MKKSRIAAPFPTRNPRCVTCPGRSAGRHEDRAVGLAWRSGLKVFTTMLEEDRRPSAACGMPMTPSGRQPCGHDTERVVLGGRKVAIQRPRVRRRRARSRCPRSRRWPLPIRSIGGSSTDAGGRGHTPIRTQLGATGPRDGKPGHQQSAVSRRFVARTTAQLAAWQSAPLDGLDLVALLIDGVHVGDHCLIVALGIAADGQKHALGIWDGSPRTRPCARACSRSPERGLRTDRSLLVILDGSRRCASVRATFGEAALVQRCQVHKMRNILEHHDRQRPWAQAILRRAYQSTDLKTAQRLLHDPPDAWRPSIPARPRASAKDSTRR